MYDIIKKISFKFRLAFIIVTESFIYWLQGVRTKEYREYRSRCVAGVRGMAMKTLTLCSWHVYSINAVSTTTTSLLRLFFFSSSCRFLYPSFWNKCVPAGFSRQCFKCPACSVLFRKSRKVTLLLRETLRTHNVWLLSTAKKGMRIRKKTKTQQSLKWDCQLISWCPLDFPLSLVKHFELTFESAL